MNISHFLNGFLIVLKYSAISNGADNFALSSAVNVEKTSCSQDEKPEKQITNKTDNGIRRAITLMFVKIDFKGEVNLKVKMKVK